MKNIIIKTVDIIFTATASFILYFVISYFFLDRITAIIVSGSLAFLTTFISFFFIIKKEKKKSVSKYKQTLFENCSFAFSCYSQEKQNNVLLSSLLKRGIKAERKNCGLFIPEKNAFVFIKYDFTPVTKSDVVKIVTKVNKGTSVYLVSESFTDEIKAFTKKFDNEILLKDSFDLFDFLEETSDLPSVDTSTVKKEKRFDFKNMLKKKKAKDYLAFGLILIFSSYFVPIKMYYLIFGCIFLALSVFSILLGKKETDTVKS